MSGRPPKEIYLQWYGEDSDAEDHRISSVEPDDQGAGGVTWCEDKIYDTDVKYVLVETVMTKNLDLVNE